MQTTENNTVNFLTHNVSRLAKNGDQFVIKIRLSDPCKNGHNDFSITGDMYEAGKPKIDKYCFGGGAIGDKIAENFPEFSIFNDLHLCDYKGAPMYAKANGFYHLTTGSKETACNYLRITEQEYIKLLEAKDEIYFCYLLESLGIVERWKIEADNAIKILEGLTGSKFVDNSTKEQYTPLTDEQTQAVKDLINEGYYSIVEIEKREAQKKADKKAALLQNLKNDFDKKHLEQLQDYEIDKIGIELFLTTSNIIYYKHTNTIVFNWQDGRYNKNYTETEFKQFIDIAKENEYLKDCLFELKQNK